MKKRNMLVVTVLCLCCITPISVNATANTTNAITNEATNEIITNDEKGIPDKGLYQAVLRALEKKDNETFTREEAEGLTVLDDYNSNYEVKWYPDVKNFKGIGCLKNLRRIRLQDHAVETLEGIEELNNIESIEVYTSRIKTLKPLEQCTNLKELLIDSGEVSSLEGVEKLTNLESLNITNNKLKNLKGIESLKQLRVLNVKGNQLTSLKEIKGLKELEVLDISNNKFKKISEVAKLTKLEWLDISYNQLKNLPNLTKLKKLKYEQLSLAHNKLSEKEIRKKLSKKLLTGGAKAKKNWLTDQVKLQNLNYKLKLTTPSSLNKITTKTTKIKGKTLPNAKVYLHILKQDNILKFVKADKNGYFEMKDLNLEEYAGNKAVFSVEIKTPGTKQWVEVVQNNSFIIKKK